MNAREVRRELEALALIVDGAVSRLDRSAAKAQDQIFRILMDRLSKMPQADGALVPGADLNKQLAIATREIDKILKAVYRPAVADYLTAYDAIDEKALKLARDYNRLTVDARLLSPLRAGIMQQAKHYLTTAVADRYVQPAKYLVMQAATTRMDVPDAEKIIRNWHKGKYVTGQNLATNIDSPRLDTYATQMARDSIHGYQGGQQEVIKKEYGLNRFIYQGGLVKDSRTFCRLLVKENRIIGLDEVHGFIDEAAKIDGKTTPNGMVPGTNQENFLQRRGGYNCIHMALAVR